MLMKLLEGKAHYTIIDEIFSMNYLLCNLTLTFYFYLCFVPTYPLTIFFLTFPFRVFVSLTDETRDK